MALNLCFWCLGVISGALLQMEEDERLDLDTVWKEIVVSATVRTSSGRFVLFSGCYLFVRL